MGVFFGLPSPDAGDGIPSQTLNKIASRFVVSTHRFYKKNEVILLFGGELSKRRVFCWITFGPHLWMSFIFNDTLGKPKHKVRSSEKVQFSLSLKKRRKFSAPIFARNEEVENFLVSQLPSFGTERNFEMFGSLPWLLMARFVEKCNHAVQRRPPTSYTVMHGVVAPFIGGFHTNLQGHCILGLHL